MAPGGIKSSLEFRSYKIDQLELEMQPILGLLTNDTIEGEWVFFQNINDVLYIEDNDI